MNSIASFALALALASAGTAAVAAAGTQEAHTRPALGLIVKLKPPVSAERESAQAARERMAAVAQRRRVGLARARGMSIGAHVLRAHRPLSMAEAGELARELRADPDVAWAVVDTLEKPLVVPNDPLHSEQWWLHAATAAAPARADFPAAWDLTMGSGDIVVAVLDSGVRRFHPEFQVGASRLLDGYDFVADVEYANDGNGRDPNPEDPGDWVSRQDIVSMPALFGTCEETASRWHGTFIAAQLAAGTNDAFGVAAGTWSGSLLPVRVAGKCGAAVSDIVDGMLWAAGYAVEGVPPNPNPARIVNLSFGGSEPCHAPYQEAIAKLRQRHAVLVAAAGNDGGENVTRPASCPGALAVTAVTQSGAKASYANQGAVVDIATTGGTVEDGIYSASNSGATMPEQDIYRLEIGTSFAAPIVSAAAALMLAVRPELTTDQLVQGIKESTRPHVALPGLPSCEGTTAVSCNCTTSTCGAGTLDAAAAVQWALDFVPPPPPSRDGGGGAAGWAWVAGLMAAVMALRQRRRPGSSADRDE